MQHDTFKDCSGGNKGAAVSSRTVAPSPLEIQAAIIAAGWAVWLVIGQPFGSMAVFHVAQLVDEWVWTMAFLLGVTAQFAGNLFCCRQARQGGLIWLGVVWMFMAGCILLANPTAPGVWTLWSLAFSAFYAAVKL